MRSGADAEDLLWESGSATNDGGIGMLQALGYSILDKEGRQVPYGARGLQKSRL